MSDSLKKSLLSEISRMDGRIKQLNANIVDYKENKDYESAVKCDIRCRQLTMIVQNLRNL